MIEQVIDKDGNVYDVKYPEITVVSISRQIKAPSGNQITQTRGLFLDKMEEQGFRPYKVDGEIQYANIEPWETYGFDGAKEWWLGVAKAFEDLGYTVTHNGQDMLLRNGRYVSRVPCEVVMNHKVKDIVRVEVDSYKKGLWAVEEIPD